MAEAAQTKAVQKNGAQRRFILSWVLFLTIETATQVVFKLAGSGLEVSGGLGPLAVRALTSPLVYTGFAFYFGCFLIWMTILKDADLGRAFPMTALIYLCTLLAAVLLFHEILTPLRGLGVLAIMAGVALLASDKDSDPPLESPVHG